MPQAAKSFFPSVGWQVVVAYGLIEAAVWTPVGLGNALIILLAALWILWAAADGRFSMRGMGIAVPAVKGTAWILAIGSAMAAAIPVLAAMGHANSAPTHVVPFGQAVIYSVWAVVQQFVLQSFFFVRLESLVGGRLAVPATAVLFALAHLPSPLLTMASFVGGVFFCEMFRRYRNIFSLGLAHALLGLTMAASFSDGLLHHMRVGMGYVRFHP